MANGEVPAGASLFVCATDNRGRIAMAGIAARRYSGRSSLHEPT
jgi:hypothetical protein